MFKKSRFLILVLLLTTQWAQARSYLKTHEDFVNLSEIEQNALIVKTMELAVELEARYEKDLTAYGYDQKRFEKYQKAITKLSSLFINSAHAQTGKPEWASMGNEFIELLKRPDSRCIFAGWVSNASSDKSGKTFCSHPARLLKNAPEAKAYPAPETNSGCKKGDAKKIQCSPVIFGYKKEAEKSLFCVDASSGAHNSSYNCMKEALAVAPTQKGDSKEARLKNLRDRLAKNPEIFKGVQEFAYKTCVCETTDKNINFNKDYHDYMRPHRTCYGLMEMIGETALCEDPKLPMDVSIFKGLRDFTKNKLASNKDADKLYSDFLNNQIKKVAPEEFARLCGGDVKLAVTKEPKKEQVIEIDKGDTAQTRTPTAETGDGPKMQTVSVSAQKEYPCTASCKPSAEKDTPFVCDFKVKNGKEEEVTLSKTPRELPKSSEDKTLEITNEIEGKERTLSCALTFETPSEEPKEDADEGTEPTLKISVGETTDKNVKITAEVTDKGEWKIIWKTTTTKKVKKKSEKKSDISDLVADGKDVDAVEEEEDKDKEEREKKEKEEKDKKEKKKKEDKKDDDKNDKDDKDKKEELVTTEDDIDALEITRAREKKTYKVCAELRKDEKTIAASPACVEVPGNEKKDAPAVNPMGNQQNPQMPRQQLNSGAIGIR